MTTLPVNVATTYPDGADPSAAAHQAAHDLLHNRFNEVIDVHDLGNNVTGDGTADDRGPLQVLIDGAPSMSAGTVRILRFQARPYKINSTLNINDKAVAFLGVAGNVGSGGRSGTRFLAGANGITMMKMGDNISPNFANGPMLYGIGFDANSKTTIRALHMEGTNNSVLDLCWFAEMDIGMRFDTGTYSGNDHAWHFFSRLRFYRIGQFGPTTGGCMAMDLGRSNGICLDQAEFIVMPPSASGLNYAIASMVADQAAGGTSSHQMSKLFFDGSSNGFTNPTTERTRMIHLEAAKATHISQCKIEQCGDGVYMGGNYDSGSFGRGNVLRDINITQCNNGFMVGCAAGAAAGDRTTGALKDGGMCDGISFSDPSSVTNKFVLVGGSLPPGFNKGVVMAA